MEILPDWTGIVPLTAGFGGESARAPGQGPADPTATERASQAAVDQAPPAADAADERKGESIAERTATLQEYSVAEQREIVRLQRIDVAVRAHEQAHMAAGGRYVTRAASYDFAIGPDGRRYAVGGEVQIDTSKVPGDPEATIEKARTIARAALAPADPSPQDLNVAAQARQMEAEARQELARQGVAESAGQATEDGEGSGADRAGEVDGNTSNDIGPGRSARDQLNQRIADFFVSGTPAFIDQYA